MWQITFVTNLFVCAAQLSVLEIADGAPKSGSVISIVRGWVREGPAAFVCPPAPEHYVGYDAETKALLSALKSGGTPVTVVGKKGCGLTSFLCHIGKVGKAKGVFPGGIYFQNMADAEGGVEAGANMLRKTLRIQLNCSGIGSAVTQDLKMWASKRGAPTLIIVHGGDTPLSLWMPVLTELACASPHLRIVLGGYMAFSSPIGSSFTVHLKGLQLSSIAELLKMIAPAREPWASVIHSRHRGLPVPVRARALPAVVEEALEELSVEATKLALGVLSAFPGKFTPSAVVAVSGLASQHVTALLAELVSLNLVKLDSEREGEFFLGPDVREHVPRSPPSPEALAAYDQWMVRFLLCYPFVCLSTDIDPHGLCCGRRAT